MYSMKFLYVLSLCLLISCQPDKHLSPQEDPPPVSADPVARPKGSPLDSKVTTTIGPGGGVLRYKDDVLLEIPAGAVADATLFGIQPITNTLDETGTAQAYRLTPEGIHFKKPVKISFTYDALSAENPTTRRVAFQRKDGVWCGVSTALDRSNNRVSIETSHFSDWVWFDQIGLRKNKESVSAGEQVELRVMEMMLAALNSTNHVDSVPLAALDEIGKAKDVVINNWKIVSGPGKLSPKINTHMIPGNAIYTAPETVNTPKEVEIQVEVESKNGYISDPKAPNGRRKFGKLILLTKIRLVPTNYFYLQVDGVRKDLSAGASGAIQNGNITVGGADNNGNLITLVCYGGGTGSYQGGIRAGESFILLSVPNNGASNRSYHNVYMDCADGQKFNGTTKITSTSGYIEGTFDGRVYYSNKECGITDSKEIRCDFKIKTI